MFLFFCVVVGFFFFIQNIHGFCGIGRTEENLFLGIDYTPRI